MSKHKEKVWNGSTRPTRIGIPVFNVVSNEEVRRGRTIRTTFENLVVIGLAVEKTMSQEQQKELLRKGESMTESSRSTKK